MTAFYSRHERHPADTTTCHRERRRPGRFARAKYRPSRTPGTRHRRWASRFGPVFDDDVWRYMPLGPVPSLALASVGAAAAIYVAVVRSRATRALAVTMLVASVMIVLAYTARGALSNDDGEFSWRLGESIRAELRNINRSLGLLNVFGDVDDLVLNGLGGFLGAGAATLLQSLGPRSMTGGGEARSSNVPA